MSIHVIAITGGVCSGKSTGFAKITEYLSERGFDVLTIREVARDLFIGRCRPDDVLGWAIFQESVIKIMMALEESYVTMARHRSRPTVILCDRGKMDGAAFTAPEVWQAILDHNNWTTTQLRDKSYGAVFHLVTAAAGAEEYYVNDAERLETPEEARVNDLLIRNVWSGHPHFRLIDNVYGSFDGKINKLLGEISTYLGIPDPIENERKFLVIGRPEIPDGVGHCVDIEQTYLIDKRFAEGEEHRVRRRGDNGSYGYYHTVKKQLGGSMRSEIEKMITPKEYIAYLQSSQLTCTIKKRRIYFLHEGKQFELDIYDDPYFKNSILEIELESDESSSQELSFPDWLTIHSEVTGDVNFSNSAIAHGVGSKLLRKTLP